MIATCMKQGIRLTNRHLTTPSSLMFTLPFMVATLPSTPRDVPEKYRFGNLEDLEDGCG